MNTTIPCWIASKITASAIELKGILALPSISVAFGELESRTHILLRAELLVFPALAELVPADFVKLLVAGSFSALSSYERAAMVLIEIDAQSLSIAINLDNQAEFTHLKWQALACLLQEAMNARCPL